MIYIHDKINNQRGRKFIYDKVDNRQGIKMNFLEKVT